MYFVNAIIAAFVAINLSIAPIIADQLKNSRSEIASVFANIITELDSFDPDIILLGDDNADNYIGNHYLDSSIPIVFWGINGLPLKYDLLDSLEKPGHNVTGVYQAGYHLDSIRFLKNSFHILKPWRFYPILYHSKFINHYFRGHLL